MEVSWCTSVSCLDNKLQRRASLLNCTYTLRSVVSGILSLHVTSSASQLSGIQPRFQHALRSSGPGYHHLGFIVDSCPVAFLSRDTECIQSKLPLIRGYLEGKLDLFLVVHDSLKRKETKGNEG